MIRFLILLTIFLIPSAFAASAFGASGDWVVGTVSYDEGDWTNTDSVFASDNRNATSTGANTHRVGAKGFGIAVTNGYLIDSIIARVEACSDGSTAARRGYQVNLSKDGGGTAVGDNITGTLKVTTDSTMTLRGTTNNKWGTTWTEAEIESANFTVTLKSTSTNTAAERCDQIAVQVWYSAPITLNKGGARKKKMGRL